MSYTKALIHNGRWHLSKEMVWAFVALAVIAALVMSSFTIEEAFGQSKWTAEKIAIVKCYERKAHLPHGLYRAMNMQENSGRLDSAAVPRVENGFFNVDGPHYQMVYRSTWNFLVANPEVAAIVPFDVERFQESSSWGPVQIMGFNIRDLGCKIAFLAMLTFEDHVKYWTKFCAPKWKQAKNNLAAFLKLYNGPRIKQSYVDHVSHWLKVYAY